MAEQPGRTSTKRTNLSKQGKSSKKKGLKGITWFYLIFFTAVIAIVCAIVGYLFIVVNGQKLLAEHGGKLNFGEASIIYDMNDNEVARLYDADENREIVEANEIPKLVMDAFVATEDQRFYEHSGLDFWAIGRALVKDVVARKAVEGGSTITQQLAKNVFLSADKTIFRKATEASIAVALEQQWTKPEILAMYLNRIYFGNRTYGIKGAAEYYFDKELKDLELWEIASLAAMPKAPNRYNPVNHPNDSKARRAVVLTLMFEQGYITKDEMERAKEVDYKAPANQKQKRVEKYPAFIDTVVDEAVELTGMTETELRVSGLHIYTTLNPAAQQVVEDEFNNDSNFDKSVDEIKSQAAIVIMDHRTGEIQALSGGRDYAKKGTNRIFSKRQPGSAFKPIAAYGPALETGNYYPSTTLKNDKKCFGNYCPRDRWGATAVSMTQAMKDSRNLAAVWMLNEVGVKRAAAFSKKLGMELPEEDYNLSMALGGLYRGVSPMQMATAYSIFANNGKSVDPHTIRVIKGRSSYEAKYEAPASTQLISKDTAWYLTEMMLAVVESGTGRKAQIDRPVAGKTGTTQHGLKNYNGDGIRDAWFVGYTAEWTAAVWMGYDDSDANHLLKNNSSQAAALFGKIMKQAMKNVKKSSFNRPQEPQEPVQEVIVPDAVNNFKLDFIGEEMKVVLTWDKIEGDNITYRVFRKEAGEANFSHFGDSLLNYIWDTSVFSGKKYTYYVTAYDSKEDAESPPSGQLSVEVTDKDYIDPDIPMELEPTPTPTPSETPQPSDDVGGEQPLPTNTPEPGHTEEPQETEGELPSFEPPVEQGGYNNSGNNNSPNNE